MQFHQSEGRRALHVLDMMSGRWQLLCVAELLLWVLECRYSVFALHQTLSYRNEHDQTTMQRRNLLSVSFMYLVTISPVRCCDNLGDRLAILLSSLQNWNYVLRVFISDPFCESLYTFSPSSSVTAERMKTLDSCKEYFSKLKDACKVRLQNKTEDQYIISHHTTQGFQFEFGFLLTFNGSQQVQSCAL